MTRPQHQAPELSSALRAVGAEPVEVPVIDIVDPADGGAGLRQAVDRMSDYDWVIVTSANGATRLLDALPDARTLGGVRLAAIGPATAAALRAGNLVADLVPEQYVAESLLEAFASPEPEQRGRVLLVRAEVARDVLPEGLRERGWEVDVVAAYRTVGRAIGDRERAEVRGADVVTFTASSTVEQFVDAFGVDDMPPVVACIGPVTAATAKEGGLTADVIADEHTILGLVDALVRWFDQT